MQNKESGIQEEVKQEFQLERMILFSDAVFAIVITLMAIEIKIPHTEEGAIKLTSKELSHQLLQLLPIFFAYAFSFLYIGRTWYAHLHLFGFLKKYDGGLVFCNLLLLFSIGLFPFGVSVLVHLMKSYLNFEIYFAILGLCYVSQLYLKHYVLVKHPELRNNKPIHDELLVYQLQRNSFFVITSAFLLFIITNLLITDMADKDLALLWFFPAAIIVRIFRKKNKAKRQILKTL